MALPFKIFGGTGQDANGHGGCLKAVGLEEGAVREGFLEGTSALWERTRVCW